MKNKKENKIIPIIGMQWGDEGKGKGVARIASGLSKNDLIVRFQGGNNAGHTIWHGGICYVFHLIPSGVFGKAQIHLGAGMVINPSALKEEASMVLKNARPTERSFRRVSFLNRLSVSPHAVLVTPTHVLLDSVSESIKGKKRIGSTGRGISPAYTDLTLRRALRVGDILEKDFKKRYHTLREEHIKTLGNVFGYKVKEGELREKEKSFFKGIMFLSKLAIKNSAELVENKIKSGNKVIAEGAQGTLHDIRFGNYPFVTSSHTIAAGVGTGLGIPPQHIGEAIGVVKAYTTKVGAGPFPTELGGEKSANWCRDQKFTLEKEKFPNPDSNSSSEFEQGIALRRQGYEVGATTGRLRRTGWLDIPLLQYAMRINNTTKLVLTKLDVLDNFKKIKVCTAYRIKNKVTINIPFDLSREKITCVYKSFPGWKGKLAGYSSKLPKEAISYIKFLEKTTKVPIIYVGTGPEEHQVVERYW